MYYQKLFSLVLVVFFVVSCGTSSVSVAPTTTFTPKPSTSTATPTSAPPTDTPTSEPPTAIPTPVPPTSTPTPEATTGTIQGKLIGAESQQPLIGAAVILCLVVGEKTCVLQADLVSISGEDGELELTEVPPGSYVVFYDPSGKASSGWKEIDGLEMILNLQGLMPIPSADRTELFSTFGGEGTIRVQKGLTLGFDENGVFSGDGSIISERYGLTMDFYEGKPITTEVQPGKTTELEIRAWGL